MEFLELLRNIIAIALEHVLLGVYACTKAMDGARQLREERADACRYLEL